MYSMVSMVLFCMCDFLFVFFSCSHSRLRTLYDIPLAWFASRFFQLFGCVFCFLLDGVMYIHNADVLRRSLRKSEYMLALLGSEMVWLSIAYAANAWMIPDDRFHRTQAPSVVPPLCDHIDCEFRSHVARARFQMESWIEKRFDQKTVIATDQINVFYAIQMRFAKNLNYLKIWICVARHECDSGRVSVRNWIRVSVM